MSISIKGALIVSGEGTFTMKDTIKALGGQWAKGLGWVVAEEQRKAVEEAVAAAGLEVVEGAAHSAP